MIASTRTAKLYSALSARERALMVLQAWKEGREEDPEVRRTAPDSQVPAFNDYIDLMNAVNERLGRYAAVLRTRVEQLGLICGWLATIRAWGLQAFDVGLGVFRLVPEPISESAYVWLKKGRRSEPRPDSAVKYAVYPDGDPENEWREKEYAELWTAIRGAPLGAFADECDTRIDKVYRILLERLQRQLAECWQDLRCIEALFNKASERFGEDAAVPVVRETVAWMRKEMEGLSDTLQTTLDEKVQLPEPTDERLAQMREIARWPASSDGVVNITVRLGD
jgi:hypothetical protein